MNIPKEFSNAILNIINTISKYRKTNDNIVFEAINNQLREIFQENLIQNDDLAFTLTIQKQNREQKGFSLQENWNFGFKFISAEQAYGSDFEFQENFKFNDIYEKITRICVNSKFSSTSKNSETSHIIEFNFNSHFNSNNGNKGKRVKEIHFQIYNKENKKSLLITLNYHLTEISNSKCKFNKQENYDQFFDKLILSRLNFQKNEEINENTKIYPKPLQIDFHKSKINLKANEILKKIISKIDSRLSDNEYFCNQIKGETKIEENSESSIELIENFDSLSSFQELLL